MKREPRLQFSDADLAEPKLEKPIKRVKKAEAKADKAQAKIPKKTVVKKKRGSVLRKWIRKSRPQS